MTSSAAVALGCVLFATQVVASGANVVDAAQSRAEYDKDDHLRLLQTVAIRKSGELPVLTLTQLNEAHDCSYTENECEKQCFTFRECRLRAKEVFGTPQQPFCILTEAKVPYLVVPWIAVRGMEDITTLPGALAYDFVFDAALTKAEQSGSEYAALINPANARTQQQMHIHFQKLTSTGTANVVKPVVARIGTSTSVFDVSNIVDGLNLPRCGRTLPFGTSAWAAKLSLKEKHSIFSTVFLWQPIKELLQDSQVVGLSDVGIVVFQNAGLIYALATYKAGSQGCSLETYMLAPVQ